MIDAAQDVPDAGVKIFHEGSPSRRSKDRECRLRRAAAENSRLGNISSGQGQQAAMRWIKALHQGVANLEFMHGAPASRLERQPRVVAVRAIVDLHLLKGQLTDAILGDERQV